MSDYVKIDNSAAQVQDDLKTGGNIKLNTDERVHYKSIKDKIAFYQHISSENYNVSIVDFQKFYEWQKGTLYTFENDNKLYLALENYTDTSGNNNPPSDDWRNQNIKIFTPEQYIKETYAKKENGIIFAEGEYRIKEDINNLRIPDNIPYFDRYGRNIEVSNEEPYSGIYKLKCSYDNEFQFLFLIQEVYKLNNNNIIYQLLYEFYDSYEDIYIYSRETGEDWKMISMTPSDNWRDTNIIQPFSVNGANNLYKDLNDKINELNNNKENIRNKSRNISDNDDKYPTSGAVKRYVDNLKQKIEDNSVGKKTELGGEIFNDYENNKAIGVSSHVEGVNNETTSNAFDAHVEGKNNIATAPQAHVEGLGNTANITAQHVEGQYADTSDTSKRYIHVTGNGLDDSYRSNAYTLDVYGNAWYAKSVDTPTVYTNQVVLLSSENKKFALKVKDDGTLYTEEISN